MVQHQINYNPRERNVQPNRKCDPRNLAMLLPLSLQTAIDCDDCKKRDSCSKYHMGDQDRVIDRSNEALSLKRSGTLTGIVLQGKMVREIGNQEENRCGKRSQHDFLMSLSLTLLDQHVPRHQQHGRDGIQSRIHCRQQINPVWSIHERSRLLFGIGWVRRRFGSFLRSGLFRQCPQPFFQCEKLIVLQGRK